MRWGGLLLGLLGSLLMLAIGALWTDNADHLAEVEQMARNAHSVAASSGAVSSPALTDVDQKLDEVRRRARASYPMVALGLISLIASAFVFKFAKVSGAVMVIAALVPAVLAPLSLIFGWLLLVAALLAFLAKPRVKAVRAAAG